MKFILEKIDQKGINGPFRFTNSVTRCDMTANKRVISIHG